MPRTADVPGALLAACDRILERDGVDGLTIRDIAVEAGIAVKSVYNHFDDKAGVLSAVVMAGFRNLSASLSGPEVEHTQRVDAPTVLGSVAATYRSFALAAPNRYRLMFAGPIERHGLLRGAGEETYNVIKSRIAPLAGRADVDASNATFFVWSALHGALTLEMSSSGFDTEMFEGHFASVVAFLARSLD